MRREVIVREVDGLLPGWRAKVEIEFAYDEPCAGDRVTPPYRGGWFVDGWDASYETSDGVPIPREHIDDAFFPKLEAAVDKWVSSAKSKLIREMEESEHGGD